MRAANEKAGVNKKPSNVTMAQAVGRNSDSHNWLFKLMKANPPAVLDVIKKDCIVSFCSLFSNNFFYNIL
jgi:hypothetical protein